MMVIVQGIIGNVIRKAGLPKKNPIEALDTYNFIYKKIL